MIGNPPPIGDKKPLEWIQDYINYFSGVKFEFLKVITAWYPVQGSDQEGNHPGKQITSGNSGYFGFVIPMETGQIKEVVCRFIPTTTGTIDYTFTLSRGAFGNDESSGSATLTADAVSVVDDIVSEIDITSLFNNVVHDDQVGIKLTVDALTTTSDIKVLGIYFKYIRS